jgi:hypothetical protein
MAIVKFPCSAFRPALHGSTFIHSKAKLQARIETLEMAGD